MFCRLPQQRYRELGDIITSVGVASQKNGRARVSKSRVSHGCSVSDDRPGIYKISIIKRIKRNKYIGIRGLSTGMQEREERCDRKREEGRQRGRVDVINPPLRWNESQKDGGDLNTAASHARR